MLGLRWALNFPSMDGSFKYWCAELSETTPSTLQACSFFSNPFLESEHIKLMTSLFINLLYAVFYLQSLSCEVINKSKGPRSISIALYFSKFPLAPLFFCVLMWPRQSLHTCCFWIFVASVPVMWSIMEIAVLCPPMLVSIVQSFLKASSSSSCVRILPLQLLRTICFQNFS